MLAALPGSAKARFAQPHGQRVGERSPSWAISKFGTRTGYRFNQANKSNKGSRKSTHGCHVHGIFEDWPEKARGKPFTAILGASSLNYHNWLRLFAKE